MGLRRTGRLVLPRMFGGSGLGWVSGYGLLTPPRPPPPVILPGAAFAALCLAGASRRASPFGLALPPAVGEGWWSCLHTEGRGKRRDMGRSRRVSDNRQDSNQPRLARAPRGGLRGLRPQAPPATFASRPVRRSPVSRLFPRPGMPGAYSVFLFTTNRRFLNSVCPSV